MHRLLRDRRLVFTYAEIMGLDGHITQQKKGGPLNIQFLIDAFKPKDRRKPPTKFDLVINNIVLRKCHVTFDRMWMPRKKGRVIDFNHLVISDIAADLRFPVLRNEDFDIDLRRLAFTEASGLKIDKISGKFHISPDRLSVAGLDVEMPGSSIQLSDINLEIDGFKKYRKTTALPATTFSCSYYQRDARRFCRVSSGSGAVQTEGPAVCRPFAGFRQSVSGEP